MPKIFLYKTKDEKKHKELGAFLWALDPGEYVIEIKKNRNIRSISANKYYHAILNIIAIETGHSHDELHEALKLKFNCEIIHFPKGGSQMIGKTTSDLDTKEFASYINRVKHWALDEFQIVIPEAKDMDYAKWMEIENNYEKVRSGY